MKFSPITKETLIERHKQRATSATRPDSSYGSEPKPLFLLDGTYNESNWNGGDAVIRQFASFLEYSEPYHAEGECRPYSFELTAVKTGFNDQNYVNLNFRMHTEEEDWFFRNYFITYYKERGKTEGVYIGNELVDVDQYLELLQLIEASGFAFSF